VLDDFKLLSETFEQQLPPTPPSQTDLQLAVEGILDPRSKEFRDAVKFTPATLANFRTGGKWVPAEHLLFLSSILAHEISQGDARIIVELPPRHGKSEEISVHTPIWFLEHWPWANVILSTYAAELASGFGRRVRDSFLLDDATDGPQLLDTRIRDDVQRTDLFLTTEGGGMASVGIGGPITGRGANLLVIDDYLKNWAEASSDLVLQSIIDWFSSVAYTRLEPGGSCVILATRWVLNDLIGWLIKNDKNHMWTVIRMPALAEDNDVLNRAPGEALWPARYPKEKLLQIRDVVGDFIFNAMYQQDPKPIGETKADPEQIRMIDQLENPQLYRWVRSWDIAATDGKKKKKGDWTVGTLIGTNGRPGLPTALTCIFDMQRAKLPPAGVENLLLNTARADGVNVPIVIEQEPGSSGKAYAEHLATNVLRGFTVTIKPPGGENKWIRAQPYVAAVSHGRILMLRAAWNQAHKDELKDFPNGRNDDTIDSASQGFNELHQSNILVPVWGRPIAQDSSVIRGDSGKLIQGVVWGRRTQPSIPGVR
jgi:predicted phage terminase large subunit-like protein